MTEDDTDGLSVDEIESNISSSSDVRKRRKA